jgi:hypothetical protein
MATQIVRAAAVSAVIGLLASTAWAQGAKPLERCPGDAVLSGTVCMDAYEASVWRVPTPGTANKALVKKIQQGKATASDLAAGGATQLGVGADNYAPCTNNQLRAQQVRERTVQPCAIAAKRSERVVPEVPADDGGVMEHRLGGRGETIDPRGQHPADRRRDGRSRHGAGHDPPLAIAAQHTLLDLLPHLVEERAYTGQGEHPDRSMVNTWIGGS